jgi:cell division septum initiation protein DivIVA
LANALVIDYQAQYRKEVEKNKQLRGENDGLRQQLAEMTRHGGSLVHAYCETRTVSRNTAGDRNDCARNGYTCEAVSGLCRTSANDSDQCSDGFLLDVDHCVPQPTHD